MPLSRSEEDQKTAWGAVFPTNPGNAALTDLETQFLQSPRHARTAVAAQAEPVLFADMRQKDHVAPLTM